MNERKEFDEMTLREQLEWVNGIAPCGAANGDDSMYIHHTQADPDAPLIYLLPIEVHDLIDALAGYIERDLAGLTAYPLPFDNTPDAEQQAAGEMTT